MNMDKATEIKTKLDKHQITSFNSPVLIVEAIINYKQRSNDGKFVAAVEKSNLLSGNNFLPSPAIFVRREFLKWLHSNPHPLKNECRDDAHEYTNIKDRFLVNPEVLFEAVDFKKDIETATEQRFEFAEKYSELMQEYTPKLITEKDIDTLLNSSEWRHKLFDILTKKYQFSSQETAELSVPLIDNQEFPEVSTFQLFIRFFDKILHRYFVKRRTPHRGDFMDLDHIKELSHSLLKFDSGP